MRCSSAAWASGWGDYTATWGRQLAGGETHVTDHLASSGPTSAEPAESAAGGLVETLCSRKKLSSCEHADDYRARTRQCEGGKVYFHGMTPAENFR